jgi:uroporphyrinogen-III decarboxylase
MKNTKKSTDTKTYTSRERVRTAIDHKEPDRVPKDMGGAIMTGIMAHALDRLREYLGLPYKKVKVFEVFQMLGEVEMDVIGRFNIDVMPVYPPVQFFGLEKKDYKPWKLWDGTEVLVPGQFNVEIDKDGGWLLHEDGDPDKPVEGKMPKNGFYFDMPSISTFEEDYTPPDLEEIKKENHLQPDELEYMAQRAEMLRARTDKALLLDQWNTVGVAWVGSIPNFLMLLYSDKKYVKDLFKIRTETSIKNFEKIKEYIGDNIDVLGLDGHDYGGQDREFFGPQVFEEVFLPYLKEQNDWIHRNTNWKSFQHICGSLVNLLPLIVETGLDILNPVQTSAKGMGPKWLKDKFGHKLTFWGGGIDSQKTMPFGTVEEVIEEVEERIRIFAPGGGYVFNSIHNIQQNTPPENIEAAFDTAHRVGVYPIR